MSIESMIPSNHLILCHPLPLPPSFFPSIRVFSNESALRIMWPRYWSFSLNISPFSECSGLISFRMDWLALLAVQGTLKSLLQYHSSVQFSSVAQSCPTLSDPMNRSTPGLPVHHQLLELAQTHVHRVGDAIQPSHSLLSPPPLPSIFLASESFLMSQFFTVYWSFNFSISMVQNVPFSVMINMI